MNDMFVRRRGQVSGPFPADEIKAMITRGEIVPLHELSYDGVEWIRAGKIWDEFVPKPQSMFEMAERRPIQLKPAVQPVDIHKSPDHKTPDRKSKSERREHSQPATAKPAAAMPVVSKQPPPPAKQAPPPPAKQPPPAAPRPADSQTPPADEPLVLSAEQEVLDDLVEVDEDDYERDRKVRPEPFVGAKALRGLSIVVACSIVAWMALSIVCVVLDYRTLDAFRPQTLERLSEIYDSGLFQASDFVRVLIFVFTFFFFVSFLCWVYFSARFLYLKSHGRMQFTPGWCVGWFLVPIMNFWKPKKVMLEIERRSEQYLRFDDPRVIRDPVVRVWWTCWVLEKVTFWLFASNRRTLAHLFDLGDPESPKYAERVRQLPKLVSDFHTNEIACLCVAFVSGIATLVLLYRFERVRPKWETRSRRRQPH